MDSNGLPDARRLPRYRERPSRLLDRRSVLAFPGAPLRLVAIHFSLITILLPHLR